MRFNAQRKSHTPQKEIELETLSGHHCKCSQKPELLFARIEIIRFNRQPSLNGKYHFEVKFFSAL
jgi:hypothetical protein